VKTWSKCKFFPEKVQGEVLFRKLCRPFQKLLDRSHVGQRRKLSLTLQGGFEHLLMGNSDAIQGTGVAGGRLLLTNQARVTLDSTERQNNHDFKESGMLIV
jgi:hypothetical protein